MKKQTKELMNRSINSLVLAIELFNRPSDRGRNESVIIFLHHAFEMLMKAIIYEKTGKVRKSGSKNTYSFERCLSMLLKDLKLLDDSERTTLLILDNHRDAAYHYYQDVSEQILYTEAQASLTLFSELLRKSFKIKLSKKIPNRVLPISTQIPKDIIMMFEGEFKDIDALLKNQRKDTEAIAKLRTVLAFQSAAKEGNEKVSDHELRKTIKERKSGKEWKVILPELAQLSIESEGEGIPIYFKIKKDAEMAFRLVHDDKEKHDGVVIKKSVDWFDKYNMGLNDLANKVGITPIQARAYMFEMKLFENKEMYDEKKVGTQVYKRYTKKAVDAIREKKEEMTVAEVWKKQGWKAMGKKPRKLHKKP